MAGLRYGSTSLAGFSSGWTFRRPLRSGRRMRVRLVLLLVCVGIWLVTAEKRMMRVTAAVPNSAGAT